MLLLLSERVVANSSPSPSFSSSFLTVAAGEKVAGRRMEMKAANMYRIKKKEPKGKDLPCKLGGKYHKNYIYP